MKRHLKCGEQQKAISNFSKYCACHAKGVSRLIRITYERSFTMRGATGINFQPHQIPRLPRKMNLMMDPHHIWNVTYNARSNRHHPPTSPNTAPATQNESHDWCTEHMKRHLQCAEQQSRPSNLTKYCACHANWISWLMHITFETSFTMRGATVNTLQPHQILRLPRKMNLMIGAHHIWNVIYNARSNRHQLPTSPNTAPATQNQHTTSDRSETDPRPFRPWSDPENANRNPPRRQGYFSHSPGADSIENYNISRSGYHSKFHHMLRLPQKVTHELHQMLHLARKVTHELHQILRLPRKLNLMIDAHHIWNVIYHARSNSQHPPTSPNTAPATQNESHDWCTSHLKRHLQCAEQQPSTSNLTKYCACHAKSAHNIWQKFAENRWNVISNARPIRDRSETDPRPFRPWSDPANANRNPPRRQGYFSHSPGADSIENYNVSRSGYHSKFHHMLRLPQKVTHELHQMLRLPRKVTRKDTWLLLLVLRLLLLGLVLLQYYYYYYYYCYYYCYDYYY